MLHLGCLKDKHMHPPRHVADLELVLVVYMSSVNFHPVLHSRSGALQISDAADPLMLVGGLTVSHLA